MTALKPTIVNKKEQETTSLSTTATTTIINNQLSPIITSSTNTRINLFQKYKQKQNKIIITSNNIDDLKTYSTPPQSPNLMINEAQEEEEEEVVGITQTTATTIEQDNVARINEDSSNSRLIKIKQNNDLLRDKLKSSYQRLRSLQTKYFQTHVAQQLNKILELKEKQQKSTTITTTNDSSSSSSIDDNSVDLLTSILKSNLTNTENNNNNNANVDLAVKSLLDDIQYEILKQAEENNNNNTRLDQDDDPIADNENIITTTTTTTMNNDYTDISDYDENNVLDSVDLTNLKLKNKQITPTTPNKNEEKKLIDSSNLSTTITTATTTTKLDTDWECVQAKLKYLKMKTKQCNDYTSKLNRLTNYKQQQQQKSMNNNNNKNKTNEHDKEAIAALSSSLQESVAAAIINVNNNNNNNKTDLITEATASRCIPYEINSHKTKSHSRLFNLNRNDLIRLDEDVIRSLYFTLKYFNNNYFKTVCTCGDLLLTTVVNKTNSTNQEYSLSDLLSMKKTCIFCHLLKEYEKNSINAIINNHTNNNTSELLLKQNNNNNNNNNTNDDRLADLNIVRTDHSYCKQFNNNNNNKRTTTSTTNNNIKLSKQVSSEQNDLLERLVNDRLCRIFDENNNNTNIFEKLIINSNDDEQFIDAGLDLSPNDLKNLPDLSYEE